jgi:hypothetical protein
MEVIKGIDFQGANNERKGDDTMEERSRAMPGGP